MSFFFLLSKAFLDLSRLNGKTVIIEGDSITAGYYASPILTKRWSTLFCTSVGATEDNRGVGGKLLVAGNNCTSQAVFNSSTIPTFNQSVHGLYILALGTNDIGFNNPSHTPSSYFSAISSAIDVLISKGWPTRKVLICAPYYIDATVSSYIGQCSSIAFDQTRPDAYRAQAKAAAALKHILYVDFSIPFIQYGSPDTLLQDKVHPTTLGHSLLSDYLLQHKIYIQ